MSPHRLAPLLAIAMSACSGPPPAPAEDNQVGSTSAPSIETAANRSKPGETAKHEVDYIGRWVGPEGLVLEVKPKAGGGMTIVNQWTLDDRGEFDGAVTAAGLRWIRNGEAVTAVASDGDATGMKWLAGKNDCLTIKPGEGYCRD